MTFSIRRISNVVLFFAFIYLFFTVVFGWLIRILSHVWLFGYKFVWIVLVFLIHYRICENIFAVLWALPLASSVIYGGCAYSPKNITNMPCNALVTTPTSRLIFLCSCCWIVFNALINVAWFQSAGWFSLCFWMRVLPGVFIILEPKS